MKILLVNFMEREARFVLDRWPKKAFCIKLDDKTKASDVTDELKAKADAIIARENSDGELETKYNNFNLKTLEGTDI